MSQVSQSDVIAVIEKALEMKPGTLKESDRAEDVDKWDSLGHLGVLSGLDRLFEGKLGDISAMAEADSVAKILELLRKNNLI